MPRGVSCTWEMLPVGLRLSSVENKRLTWYHLLFLFHFLCAQHVSDINISIIRSLRIFCWINTLVVCSWFDVCWWSRLNYHWCFSLQHGYHSNPTTPKHQHSSNPVHTTNVVIRQKSRKLLVMDILMSETCWAHKKWYKNSKWHQVGILFSPITTMHGPINIRLSNVFLFMSVPDKNFWNVEAPGCTRIEIVVAIEICFYANYPTSRSLRCTHIPSPIFIFSPHVCCDAVSIDVE